jgi:hypothetical protein
MRRLVRVLLAAAVAATLGAAGAEAQGSNLGSYGTQFVPGAIAGKVTSAGVPVAGALVETNDGHHVTTDANGDYVLYVDASGLYTVRVTTASRKAGPTQVSVTLGATTPLHFTTLKPRPRPRRNLPTTPTAPPAPSGPG